MQITSQSPIVILTGAGISKESGLDTFRDAGGIWSKYDMNEVCTPEGYIRNPALVHEFYNGRRAQILEKTIQPNPAHQALARLQKEWDGGVTLVTQNIDDLHERGGSGALVHMHGELKKAFCTACRHTVMIEEALSIETVCTGCQTVGTVRPDIVWFGEMPYHMDNIYHALENCDLFLSIGTSGNVYPAAGFVAHARHNGACCMEINLEPSSGATLFHEHIYGPASIEVPRFVEDLLSSCHDLTQQQA